MRFVLIAALLLQTTTVAAQPQRGNEEAARLERIAGLEAEGAPSFPAYLSALVQMSTFYANQARYAEALPLLRRAHRASEENLGAQHATTEELRVTILLMERFAPEERGRGTGPDPAH